MWQRRQITKEQAFQKLRHYCAYQERCHGEVKEKAYSFGLRKADVEELLSDLIQEGYLNEERFAIAFAGGKFRIKQWGKTKIRYALRQKGVSEYCIRAGLKAIDEDEYRKTFLKLANGKWKTIRGPGVNQYVKMSKTRDYLLQKGYEAEIINAFIASRSEKQG